MLVFAVSSGINFFSCFKEGGERMLVNWCIYIWILSLWQESVLAVVIIISTVIKNYLWDSFFSVQVEVESTQLNIFIEQKH